MFDVRKCSGEASSGGVEGNLFFKLFDELDVSSSRRESARWSLGSCDLNRYSIRRLTDFYGTRIFVIILLILVQKILIDVESSLIIFIALFNSRFPCICSIFLQFPFLLTARKQHFVCQLQWFPTSKTSGFKGILVSFGNELLFIGTGNVCVDKVLLRSP